MDELKIVVPDPEGKYYLFSLSYKEWEFRSQS